MSFTDREFRDALGQFATGVAVVTAEVDGTLLGSTVSSFNSVSLAPPLILFSLARSAQTFSLWLQAKHFGITVLERARTTCPTGSRAAALRNGPASLHCAARAVCRLCAAVSLLRMREVRLPRRRRPRDCRWPRPVVHPERGSAAAFLRRPLPTASLRPADRVAAGPGPSGCTAGDGRRGCRKRRGCVRTRGCGGEIRDGPRS